jgi:hypothetical protein
MREEVLFNLAETDWDATAARDGRDWRLRMRHAAQGDREFTLHIDVEQCAGRVNDDAACWPLAFHERHLRNFALYESWDAMLAGLRAGPAELAQRDVMLPIPGGFRVELWAGEPRFPLPFLQPRVLDAGGRTVFDLRTTSWAAAIRIDATRPVVTLLFVSDEAVGREAPARHPVILDLVSRRVTCPTLVGSTTIGMLQGLVRRVRGAKWMLEELPQWFAKGAAVPLPPVPSSLPARTPG